MATEFTEQDKKEIYLAYRRVVRPLSYLTWARYGLKIRKAFEFADKAHYGVRRKSGEPYMTHPLAVAEIIVKEMGIEDPVAIQAAFLHDVVEDTEVPLDRIEHEFGKDVRNIVDGLTKIEGINFTDEQMSVQAENFRKIFLTLYTDIRVILIKLADRLHNMRTLGAKPGVKILKTTSETLYIYAPLAHRLGLFKVKSELEDLSLKYSQPAVYEDIEQKIADYKVDAEAYINAFIGDISGLLHELGQKYTIKSRFKSVFSIYKKIVDKKVPFEDIFDLYAIRIILKDVPQAKEYAVCMAAYSAITRKFTPNPKRIRDWITRPRENGYESLHVTVQGPEGKWIEVQIRTERMDESAEKGIAAHWRYKDGVKQEDEWLTQWISQIRNTLENPDIDALEVVREFREKLQINNLYVFTPQGKEIQLPSGATALDFAYYVHTEVGNHALAAKVNNQTVALEHRLRPGDLCEIITSPTQGPKQDWIGIARTQRAHDAIRVELKKQKRELVRRGRLTFLWMARQYGVDELHPYFKELLAYFMVPSEEEFFFRIANRRISQEKAQEFIRLKQGGGAVGSESLERWEEQRRLFQERMTELGVKADSLVAGENTDMDHYRLAECCKPVQGDSIIGLEEKGKVIIHRDACPEALIRMAQHGNKIIRTKWTANSQLSDIVFLTIIKVEGTDRQGMLIDLLRVISDKMSINIRKVTIESDDSLPGAKQFQGLFYVYVHNKSEMESLVRHLMRVPNVLKAYRHDEIPT